MIYYTCNLKFKNIQHVTWLYLNPGQGVENFLCDLPINYQGWIKEDFFENKIFFFLLFIKRR